MRRDPSGLLLIILLIGSLGLVVWATRHPESEWLKNAEEWPVAGPLVGRFRAHYLPRQPEDAAAGEFERYDVGGDPEVRDPQESVTTTVVQRGVWPRIGTALHSEADGRSPVISSVSEVARMPLLEQDGDWYRVQHQGRIAWAHLPGYDDGGAPPLGSEPEAPQPLPGRPPDPELLALARSLLGSEAQPSQLGGYQFFTDHQDGSLVSVLNGVAGSLERTYVDRYGVAPIDRPREAIVLFEIERDYRSLQNSLERLAGLPAVGLVSRGVVAVYVGGRSGQEVASTLVHELAHLISRRALGPALPPWLDEGLADDLAHSRIDEDGQLVPADLGGSSVTYGSTLVWHGGRAAVVELGRAFAAGRVVPLEELLALDWRSFVEPHAEPHYPQSGLFVRYLTESESGLRDGFHAYLDGVASGESVGPEVLLRHLGTSWADLEEGFRDWVLMRFADIHRATTAGAEAGR